MPLQVLSPDSVAGGTSSHDPGSHDHPPSFPPSLLTQGVEAVRGKAKDIAFLWVQRLGGPLPDHLQRPQPGRQHLLQLPAKPVLEGRPLPAPWLRTRGGTGQG